MLCGMVWSKFGKEDAGLELIRAMDSSDPDIRVLARTLLAQANGGSKELLASAWARDEMSATMATLCGFQLNEKIEQPPMGGKSWVASGSA
jgi:hypothetical protein